mmetsp:Transcript_26666/g.39544  ORF Transcript_26666/g.39544 Transcript_26666/m.39544 type:complete len:110 (-) Transcript_26666:119-448(-)
MPYCLCSNDGLFKDPLDDIMDEFMEEHLSNDEECMVEGDIANNACHRSIAMEQGDFEGIPFYTLEFPSDPTANDAVRSLYTCVNPQPQVGSTGKAKFDSVMSQFKLVVG